MGAKTKVEITPGWVAEKKSFYGVLTLSRPGAAGLVAVVTMRLKLPT